MSEKIIFDGDGALFGLPALIHAGRMVLIGGLPLMEDRSDYDPWRTGMLDLIRPGEAETGTQINEDSRYLGKW